MTATHIVLGAGPVSRAVLAALGARGLEPTVVTRSGAAVPGAVSVRADLSDAAATMQALAGADVVYQCAQPAYDRWPEQFPPLQTNVLHAAGSAGAVLVAAENLYGYGPVSGPITERLPLQASTSKGAVRAAMWRQLEAAHRAGTVQAVSARASDLFGPGVRASAVGDRFFGPLVAGRVVRVAGDPDRLHSYTYAPDLGEAMVRLAQMPSSWGRAWHVPNAPVTSTREFAARAAGIAGTEAKLRRLARWQVRLVGVAVPAVREVVELLYEFESDWVVDHARYAALLGDHATPLDDALDATVASYRFAPTEPARRLKGRHQPA